MSKISAILLTITALMSATATAEMRAVEQAIESTTSSLSLPERLPSTIALAPCDNGCTPTLLQLTANTQFLLGRRSVTFAELRELSAKPRLNVAVYFEPQSKVVTRIVVSAQ